MSLTGSLSSALSGLTAASKGAQLVSSNVANANTEGYAPRRLQISSVSVAGIGAGVRIDGVQRAVDQAVLADRRSADADVAHASVVANFFTRIETIAGLPGDPGSLSAALVGFETALIDAASRPDQAVRLDTAVAAAATLAETVSAASGSIQSERVKADKEIAQEVQVLANALNTVADLNIQISKRFAAGRDAVSLLDQRQVQIDQIARIVPVSVLSRDQGQVALVSSGGGVLLDGPPASIEFSQTRVITPDMTFEGGALGTVTMNGQPVDLSRDVNMLRGGSLEALFLVRDSLAVESQEGLDAFAADMLARFEDPLVDASLSAGMAGLFTDSGVPYDALREVGLAQRIRVNAMLDPAQGGETWRIRDGVGQVAPGPRGDASQLMAFVDVLSDERSPASASAGPEARNTFTLLSDFLSDIGRLHLQAETALTTSNATWRAWRSVELEGRVDTDAEMQKLLLIEQAYAANAKVIKAVEDMLDALIRI
ncbi:MAG: flagellar hook-associated protein FlgK [Dinoroseobacter sp.]|nr:flagellar hook-associated protein FlgK [Dinoroseobacter sp.]